MSYGEYKILERYRVGKEIGASDIQIDDIVDHLQNIGLIKEIGETKILLTFKGKQEVESLKST